MSEGTSESSYSATSDPTEIQGSGVCNIPIHRVKEVNLPTIINQVHSNKSETAPGLRTLEILEISNPSDPQEEKHWSSEAHLLITCIGFSVGIGNIWRFPYIAFKNGGGAFLIPYLLATLVISVPLYYMELLIGQWSNLDPVRVWSFCPFFKGLGYTVILCTMVIQIYYNVIMAYSLLYIMETFRSVLPWSGCFKWWGADDNCYEMKKGIVQCNPNSTSNPPNCTNATEASVDQFWRIHVLGISSGLDDPGTIKWDLSLVLLVTWIIVCALVIGRHHTKVSFKIKTVYFTALYPFLILIIYCVYSANLPGAAKGLSKLFVPKWSSLLDIGVWSEAAETSIYSVGLGTGALVIFGRKTELSYDISRCAYVSCAVDALTSVLAATVTFMVVGYLADTIGVEFCEKTLNGHGLVFVTYPEAAVMMVPPQLWSFLFFLMLFSLAMDVSVSMTESVALGAEVLFFPSNSHTKIFVVCVSAFLYIVGLSCVTNGGAFVLNLLDYYAGGHCLLGTVMFEAIAFGWGFVGNGGPKNMEKMLGFKMSLFMRICFIFLAPVCLIVLFVETTSSTSMGPIYGVPFPSYVDAIGWSIAAAVMLPIPVCMLIVLVQNRKNLSKAFKPGKIWRKAVSQRLKRTA